VFICCCHATTIGVFWRHKTRLQKLGSCVFFFSFVVGGGGDGDIGTDMDRDLGCCGDRNDCGEVDLALKLVFGTNSECETRSDMMLLVL
jgi:hypothetical protein